jgi:hypothetical protein
VAENSLALDITKTNEIATGDSKTGKMTVVVKTMTVFESKYGNLMKASSRKILNKPNKWLNSKKQHLNRSKKHHNDLSKPMNDVRERLLV